MVRLDSAESLVKHLTTLVNGKLKNEDKIRVLADALVALAKDVAKIKKVSDKANSGHEE
jgi:hypothetical protein